jgi:t-SNARE complex subunit (syntaxin)
MLEQSVAELHQMFLDFALLTERQGEILDQIEFHVTNAADHVEDGNVDISTAIVYQKEIRKKQWYVVQSRIQPSYLAESISLYTVVRVFVVQLDH